MPHFPPELNPSTGMKDIDSKQNLVLAHSCRWWEVFGAVRWGKLQSFECWIRLKPSSRVPPVNTVPVVPPVSTAPYGGQMESFLGNFRAEPSAPPVSKAPYGGERESLWGKRFKSCSCVPLVSKAPYGGERESLWGKRVAAGFGLWSLCTTWHQTNGHWSEENKLVMNSSTAPAMLAYRVRIMEL